MKLYALITLLKLQVQFVITVLLKLQVQSGYFFIVAYGYIVSRKKKYWVLSPSIWITSNRRTILYI